MIRRRRAQLNQTLYTIGINLQQYFLIIAKQQVITEIAAQHIPPGTCDADIAVQAASQLINTASAYFIREHPETIGITCDHTVIP